MSDHDDSMERLQRANVADAALRAEDKIEDAAEEARILVADEARVAAAELTNEVAVLRKEITVLQKVDDFKAKVYTVAIAFGILVSLSFAGLWWVNHDVDNGVRAIRTDLEVHRIRNEASHDCLSEKLANLPTPEQRTDLTLTERFVEEFVGCVARLAPTIVPPRAPDIRKVGGR